MKPTGRLGRRRNIGSVGSDNICSGGIYNKRRGVASSPPAMPSHLSRVLPLGGPAPRLLRFAAMAGRSRPFPYSITSSARASSVGGWAGLAVDGARTSRACWSVAHTRGRASLDLILVEAHEQKQDEDCDDDTGKDRQPHGESSPQRKISTTDSLNENRPIEEAGLISVVLRESLGPYAFTVDPTLRTKS